MAGGTMKTTATIDDDLYAKALEMADPDMGNGDRGPADARVTALDA
jgi:hypothetical protein